MRPIVSYFNHPLKKLFNTTAKAITVMMKTSKVEHLAIWGTGKLLLQSRKTDGATKRRNSNG